MGRPQHDQGDPRELSRANVADRYLARTGYDSQQIADEPVAPDRPANLFEPVEHVAATHGRFERDAIARSPQLWLTLHRGRLLAGGAAAATAVAAASLGRRR